jgi:serine protease Do
MFSQRLLAPLALTAMLLTHGAVRAQDSFAAAADEVNKKMVKVFGSGGFKGVVDYGTGVLVSAEGHILTVASPILDTPELRVHLYDGRRYPAKVVMIEPELDAALIKIDDDKLLPVPFFDIAAAAKNPVAQTGDWVLAFSNQFHIATRDEPMSVQHGVIASFAKLDARRGVHDAPYSGDCYVLDAITNNPGAGGGALTTRKGELLGMIGKELRNRRSETWINYAVPVQSLAKFVEDTKAGKYVRKPRPEKVASGAYHGIVLVANPVANQTPPFVEEVTPGSPAAKAGLKTDDLISYVNGEPVPSIESLLKFLNDTPAGETLTLEVRRVDKSVAGSGDKLITISLKLEQPVAKTPAPKK